MFSKNGNLIFGIEPFMDKVLQMRLLSSDTHRHRLGYKYDQISINCPYKAKFQNTS